MLLQYINTVHDILLVIALKGEVQIDRFNIKSGKLEILARSVIENKDFLLVLYIISIMIGTYEYHTLHGIIYKRSYIGSPNINLFIATQSHNIYMLQYFKESS